MSELIMLGRPSHRPRPTTSLVSVLQEMQNGVKNYWARWLAWRRQRAALLSLGDRELKDLGISRAQANFDYTWNNWRS